MLSTPAAKAASAATLSGIVTADVFGVPYWTIGLGMGIVALAVIGKAMIEIAKTIEKGDPVHLARSLAWMGALIVSSPFISMTYFALLAWIHYPVDPFSIVVLGGIGYAGPKGVEKLAAIAQGFFDRFLAAVPKRSNDEKPH